jgi:pyridoxal phosphate enzyme (YggS family)
MIGHLQSRKAKIVAAHFDMMHSLDGLSLAEKLNRLLAETGRQLPVLLELNVGEEESKSGWRVRDEADWSRLLPDVEVILQLKQLQVRGLMTMPPLEMEAEQARPYFARLRALRDRLQQTFPVCDWRELSMGTSADFEVAIEEGATYVRIGQAVLGPRPPKGV